MDGTAVNCWAYYWDTVYCSMYIVRNMSWPVYMHESRKRIAKYSNT